MKYLLLLSFFVFAKPVKTVAQQNENKIDSTVLLRTSKTLAIHSDSTAQQQQQEIDNTEDRNIKRDKLTSLIAIAIATISVLLLYNVRSR
jgi:hypothetical protein